MLYRQDVDDVYEVSLGWLSSAPKTRPDSPAPSHANAPLPPLHPVHVHPLQGMEILAGIASVLSVIIALFRLSSWRRRNQLIYIDMNTLWTCVLRFSGVATVETK